MEGLGFSSHPDLLLGPDKESDAGVFRISDDLAMVQSVDFFTPVVDDPYDFGQIAAANSLSDLYALGARPLTAMNLLCFPPKDLPLEMAREILRGGLDKIHEAGAVLVGGHSVDDREPKYGLAVTGLIHPDRWVSKAGARPGDLLLLTKPLGLGILTTALKAGLLSTSQQERIVSLMKELNRGASEAMMEVGVHAATDVTGFGLVGHALEMAKASGVTIVIESKRVPILEGASGFLSQGMIPEGDYAISGYCGKSLDVSVGVGHETLELLMDSQTSGGLLVAFPPRKKDAIMTGMIEKGVYEASVIGEVREGPGVVRVT